MPVRPSHSYLLPHILRRLLRSRETIAFPAGPVELPESYRGQVVVDISRCSGCGLCARACPTGGLLVERLEGGGVRVRIAHDR
ncbi:MAG: 4Fe-4S binding protein, partial [Chloroflexota bacterium]